MSSNNYDHTHVNNYDHVMLYIRVTTSVSLTLSIGALFILLLKSVNGGGLLNITCLTLSTAAAATDIVPSKSMKKFLQLHKLDLSNEVLKLISLLVLYVPRESSFSLIQILVLNLNV